MRESPYQINNGNKAAEKKRQITQQYSASRNKSRQSLSWNYNTAFQKYTNIERAEKKEKNQMPTTHTATCIPRQ